MAEYIELSKLEKAVIVKQTEEEKYWFDWLKQFRTTKEYSVKEQAVDNFLRGYHEAVQFMLSTNEELLLKSADVVEVVRCGQCKHATDDIIVEGVCYCHKIQQGMFVDGFCSYGERKCEDA